LSPDSWLQLPAYVPQHHTTCNCRNNQVKQLNVAGDACRLSALLCTPAAGKCTGTPPAERVESASLAACGVPKSTPPAELRQGVQYFPKQPALLYFVGSQGFTRQLPQHTPCVQDMHPTTDAAYTSSLLAVQPGFKSHARSPVGLGAAVAARPQPVNHNSKLHITAAAVTTGLGLLPQHFLEQPEQFMLAALQAWGTAAVIAASTKTTNSSCTSQLLPYHVLVGKYRPGTAATTPSCTRQLLPLLSRPLVDAHSPCSPYSMILQ
jgi:hypothetical protein